MRIDTSRSLERKSIACTHKALQVTDSLLALVNRYALEPVAAEQVYVGQIRLANDQYDRSHERFPREYLNRFVETLPGKSLLGGHDYSSLPLGRYIAAEVVKEDGVQWLLTTYYVRASSPIVDDIKLGVLKHASIGFYHGGRVCDLCGKAYDWWMSADLDGLALDEEEWDAYCMHYAGRVYDGKLCTLTYANDEEAEAVEGSLVWLGCQYGAETVRGAAAQPLMTKAAVMAALAERRQIRKGGGMDEHEKKAAAARDSRLKELEAQVAALEAKVAELTPLAKDGETYRGWQKTEILRLSKSLGEEKTGESIVKALTNADAATLDACRQEWDERHAKAFAQGGGKANADETPALPPPTAYEIRYGRRPRQEGE